MPAPYLVSMMGRRLASPVRMVFLLASAACIACAAEDPTSRPFVTVLTPDTATTLGPSRPATVLGGRFLPGALVVWNGSDRQATFVSATELQFTISTPSLSQVDTADIGVRNPDGGSSNTVPLFIEPLFNWVTRSPIPGAEVNTDALIQLSFTRSLDTATIGSNFAVRDSASGIDIASTASYDAVLRAARLTAPLEYNRTYAARATTGLRSERGNALATLPAWTFYTPLGRITTLINDSSWPSLAIAPNGTLHIAFMAPGIKFGTASCSAMCGDSTGWVHEPLLPNGGPYVTLAVDGQGRRHVAFVDTTYRIKYGTSVAGSWQFVSVSAAGVGFPHMAVEAGGRAHIAWSSGKLEYATCETDCTVSSSWTTRVIDSTGNPGPFRAIATGPGGSVHVAYGGSDLRYATCASQCATTAWQTATIDSIGDVGSGAGIAVESSGIVHVVALDHTNGTLKYGQCLSNCTSAASWSFTAVSEVATPSVGAPSGTYYARVVAHAGGIALSYHDRRSLQLYTADCSASCTTPSAWVVRRVSRTNGGTVLSSFYPSLVVTPSGDHHVVFESGLLIDRLRYARF